MPFQRKDAVVKRPHLRSQPARHMDTVGDVPDWNFVFTPPRPQSRPHPTADDTVQVRHGVRTAAALECKDGHAERFARVVGVDAPQSDQSTGSEPQLIGDRTQVLFKQSPVEPIVTGRDRRMYAQRQAATEIQKTRPLRRRQDPLFRRLAG